MRNVYTSQTLMLCKPFLASGDICCLLITFANSLDPDQDKSNVGSDLDTLIMLKEFFENVNFEKKA